MSGEAKRQIGFSIVNGFEAHAQININITLRMYNVRYLRYQYIAHREMAHKQTPTDEIHWQE